MSTFAYSPSSGLPPSQLQQQQSLNNAGVAEQHTVISMNTLGGDPITINTGNFQWERVAKLFSGTWSPALSPPLLHVAPCEAGRICASSATALGGREGQAAVVSHP